MDASEDGEWPREGHDRSLSASQPPRMEKPLPPHQGLPAALFRAGWHPGNDSSSHGVDSWRRCPEGKRQQSLEGLLCQRENSGTDQQSDTPGLKTCWRNSLQVLPALNQRWMPQATQQTGRPKSAPGRVGKTQEAGRRPTCGQAASPYLHPSSWGEYESSPSHRCHLGWEKGELRKPMKKEHFCQKDCSCKLQKTDGPNTFNCKS